jgi:hypothetical protein
LGVLDAEAVIVDPRQQRDSVALAQEEKSPAGHLHPKGGADGAFDVEDEGFPRVGPAGRGEIGPVRHSLLRNHAIILDHDAREPPLITTLAFTVPGFVLDRVTMPQRGRADVGRHR